mmetsp:Transcript_57563/g.132765  ORF Transcript_57563/g.132765 Transcript_57563/m.132765 type:complete len:362 (+) Transcript_57563:2181-3266(+)
MGIQNLHAGGGVALGEQFETAPEHLSQLFGTESVSRALGHAQDAVEVHFLGSHHSRLPLLRHLPSLLKVQEPILVLGLVLLPASHGHGRRAAGQHWAEGEDTKTFHYRNQLVLQVLDELCAGLHDRLVGPRVPVQIPFKDCCRHVCDVIAQEFVQRPRPRLQPAERVDECKDNGEDCDYFAHLLLGMVHESSQDEPINKHRNGEKYDQHPKNPQDLIQGVEEPTNPVLGEEREHTPHKPPPLPREHPLVQWRRGQHNAHESKIEDLQGRQEHKDPTEHQSEVEIGESLRIDPVVGFGLDGNVWGIGPLNTIVCKGHTIAFKNQRLVEVKLLGRGIQPIVFEHKNQHNHSNQGLDAQLPNEK